MNWVPIVVAVVTGTLGLLGAIGTCMGVLWRVSAIVAVATNEQEALRRDLEKQAAAIDGLRRGFETVGNDQLLVRKDLSAMGELLAKHGQKLSEFPPMRTELDSISEEVDELRGVVPALRERTALLEQKTKSTAGMPAVRPPRLRRDEDT